MTIEEICKRAFENKYITAKLSTTQKDDLINQAADDLVKNTDQILSANEMDMKNGKENGLSQRSGRASCRERV